MESVLKSCPFCGAKPEMKFFLKRFYKIVCSNVVCPASGSRAYKKERVAIEYWNRREGTKV